MSKETRSIPKLIWSWFTTTWPLFLAAAATAVFGWWVFCLASEIVQTGSGQMISRWDQFRSGEPNTMGDTLAGFIGSLTLIWVVASVVQQSMELRAQRREFEEMAVAMGQQVEAMQAQSDLLKFQRTNLEQNRSRDNLNRYLEMLCSTLQELGGIRHWEVLAEGTSTNVQTGAVEKTSEWRHFAPGIGGGSSIDEKIQSSLETLRAFKQFLDTPGKLRPREMQKSAAAPLFKKVFPAIAKCLELREDLDDVEKLRLDRLELEKIRNLIEDLLRRDLWDTTGRGKERFTP